MRTQASLVDKNEWANAHNTSLVFTYPPLRSAPCFARPFKGVEPMAQQNHLLEVRYREPKLLGMGYECVANDVPQIRRLNALRRPTLIFGYRGPFRTAQRAVCGTYDTLSNSFPIALLKLLGFENL